MSDDLSVEGLRAEWARELSQLEEDEQAAEIHAMLVDALDAVEQSAEVEEAVNLALAAFAGEVEGEKMEARNRAAAEAEFTDSARLQRENDELRAENARLKGQVC